MKTPCVAVIFSSQRTTQDPEGYAEAAARMEELAAQQPGFLGVESIREGINGVTISYWTDEASARAWGQHPEHRDIQQQGRERWYSSYSLRIGEVTRAYEWDASR